MKFDVVVGNPPFEDGTTSGNGNNIKLWPKFITMGLKLVTDTGFIAMVTPTSGLAPNNETLNNFKNNHLQYLNLRSVGKHFIGVGSQFSAWVFSAWVLQKGSKGITTIDGEEYELASLEYFPPNSEHFSIHQKVIFSNTLGGFKIESDETANVILTKKKPEFLSREKTITHTNEAFHTNKQSLWSSRPLKDQQKEKVIFTTSGHVKPEYDNGQRGVSNTSRYILVSSKEEADSICSLFRSKVYQFIMETAKWNGFVNVNVIKLLPKLNSTHDWTDEELYAHFNLTQEEIDLIESTIK